LILNYHLKIDNYKFLFFNIKHQIFYQYAYNSFKLRINALLEFIKFYNLFSKKLLSTIAKIIKKKRIEQQKKNKKIFYNYFKN